MKTTSLSSTLMPVKLLLNNPSLPITRFFSMKFGPASISAPRPVLAFSRVFPLRLRTFRTPRTGSSFGYERKIVGGSKSLVDDEADPTRHRGGRSDEPDGNPRGRVREREAYPAKRSRRDSGGGGGESRTRGGFRSSSQSFPPRNRDGDEREGRSFSRGGSSSNDRFGESNRRRGSSSNQTAFTRNPRMDRRFDNKFADNAVKEDECTARKSSNYGEYSRSNSSSLSKRGGRAVDSGFRRGGATGGGRDAMKAMRVVDEDEDEDDEVNELGVGIGGLLTEEDSDSAASEEEDTLPSRMAVPKSSTAGDSDSYLSDTR